MKIEDESTTIRSFYLTPASGEPIFDYEAGQHLPIRIALKPSREKLIRTYTLSSAPADVLYRISVKREAEGTVSRYLHDHLAVGDVIEAKGPQGAFHIDAAAQRPILLIGGGVGITPMIAMARHIANEAVRTRQLRPVTIFHAARNVEERAFAAAFRSLESESEGIIRYHSLVSDPGTTAIGADDINFVGRLTPDLLRAVLPLDDYDCYLCGPGGFIQAVYETLRSLGVADERLHAESFGPSSLRRDSGREPVSGKDEAETAIIAFTQSGFELPWHRGDGTLLEVAEQHGLQPEFSCRGGSCGTCVTRLTRGEVVNRNPVAAREHDEILICSAVPAEGSDRVELDL